MIDKGRPEEGFRFLELDLQMVVSHLVDAGNGKKVLCKSTQLCKSLVDILTLSLFASSQFLFPECHCRLFVGCLTPPTVSAHEEETSYEAHVSESYYMA
ncbi:hypothetical protein H671_1g1330 [Cricetulus griseus]|uniref:Uncharacterized protein n=1 Tax=Cricetulus griseus TaxID=10029 RepID=A0A061IRB3_CRIGR|nr:hypothetical protein H671_1g1330 [Cricetulus griseus]